MSGIERREDGSVRLPMTALYLWTGAAIVATLMLGAFIFAQISPDQFGPRTFIIGLLSFVYPWTHAAYAVIVQHYPGWMRGPSPALLHWLTLGTALLTFVVGPTLHLLGWRRRAEERREGRDPERLRGATIAMTIGALINMAAGIGVFPLAVTEHRMVRQTENASSVQRERDHIIADIRSISTRVAEYYIIPKRLGGGGGTLDGFEIPEGLRSTETAAYALERVNPMVLQLTARSRRYADGIITAQIDTSGFTGNYTFSDAMRPGY